MTAKYIFIHTKREKNNMATSGRFKLYNQERSYNSKKRWEWENRHNIARDKLGRMQARAADRAIRKSRGGHRAFDQFMASSMGY